MHANQTGFAKLKRSACFRASVGADPEGAAKTMGHMKVKKPWFKTNPMLFHQETANLRAAYAFLKMTREAKGTPINEAFSLLEDAAVVSPGSSAIYYASGVEK